MVVPAGDDAAAFVPTPGHLIVAATDALVDGVHFQSRSWPPWCIGFKALAVNLSDLAAMGARPRYALLALALPPPASDSFLKRVARGMARACDESGVDLIGGNVTRARDLALTISIIGEIEPDGLMKRSGASAGDVVWVSGTLGDSALGLASMLDRTSPPKRLRALEARHCAPEARVALGAALSSRRAATAAIDISDGLVADLRHLLESSSVGAEIRLQDIPLSPAYRRAGASGRGRLDPALCGGEDYELLFTARPGSTRLVKEASKVSGTQVTAIGEVTLGRALTLIDSRGNEHPPPNGGWCHR